MGYTLPLRFIKVSQNRSDKKQFDVSICATRIVAMMSTDIVQARKAISDERKSGTLINAAGVTKANTAIFLDNGSVIASPLSVRRLMRIIDKANEYGYTKKSKRMTVYEVQDPEPDLKNEQTDEMSSYYDNSDEDMGGYEDTLDEYEGYDDDEV